MLQYTHIRDFMNYNLLKNKGENNIKNTAAKTIIYLPPMLGHWKIISEGDYKIKKNNGIYNIDFNGLDIGIRNEKVIPCDCSKPIHKKHNHPMIFTEDGFGLLLDEHYKRAREFAPSFNLDNTERINGIYYETHIDITTPKGHIYIIPKTIRWEELWGPADKDHEKDCDVYYMIIGSKPEDIDCLVKEYGGLKEHNDDIRERSCVI